MTCWSCRHYRPEHCAEGRLEYPQGSPETCAEFSYEPGSDEAEREDP